MRLLLISNSTNPDLYVAGLREGTMLPVEDEKISLNWSTENQDLQERICSAGARPGKRSLLPFKT